MNQSYSSINIGNHYVPDQLCNQYYCDVGHRVGQVHSYSDVGDKLVMVQVQSAAYSLVREKTSQRVGNMVLKIATGWSGTILSEDWSQVGQRHFLGKDKIGLVRVYDQHTKQG